MHDLHGKENGVVLNCFMTKKRAESKSDAEIDDFENDC